MKANKKLLKQIISIIAFLIYGISVILLSVYLFPNFSGIKAIVAFSWIIIALNLFFLFNSLFARFNLFSKKVQKFSQRNLIEYTSNILQDESKYINPLIKEGSIIFYQQCMIIALEFLLPYAMGYLCLNSFSVLGCVLLLKYFLNFHVYFSLLDDYLPKNRIPKLYKTMVKIKNKVCIKNKAYITYAANEQFEWKIVGNKILFTIGLDLLSILSNEELEAYFYEAFINMEGNEFKNNIRLNVLSRNINFLIFNGIVPLEISNCGLFLGKINFYLHLTGEKNRNKYIRKIKNTDYMIPFLNGKFKQTQYFLVSLYLDANDYISINHNDFYMSLLQLKKERISIISWMNEISEKAVHSSKSRFLTYSETSRILEVKHQEINYDFNTNYQMEINFIKKRLPLNDKNEVNKYLEKYFEAIKFAYNYHQEYLKIENPSLEDKIQFALSKFISRDYQGCLNLALELLSEHPNNDSISFLLGNLYVKGYNSSKCEDYLLRNYFKHTIKINAINLLEDFYTRNGDIDKINSIANKIIEAQKINIQDRIELNSEIINDGNLRNINSNNQTYQEIIKECKEISAIKNLFMFEKFSQYGDYLYLIVVISSEDDLEKINTLKEYLINRDDVNAITKVHFEINKKNIQDFSDYQIY